MVQMAFGGLCDGSRGGRRHGAWDGCTVLTVKWVSVWLMVGQGQSLDAGVAGEDVSVCCLWNGALFEKKMCSMYSKPAV